MSTPDPRARHLIDTATLADRLADPHLRVFDCTVHLDPLPDNSGHVARSGRADYDRRHIPASAFLDLSADLSDTTSRLRFVVPPPAELAAKAGRLGIGDASEVVLYDRVRNQWAARVWWMLRSIGVERVRVLDGGFVKWHAEDRPVTGDPLVYPPARLTARPRAGMIVSRDEVKGAIGRPDTLILNALTPEQHAGKGGVHYGRPGRIPGSVCVAARSIIDPETQAYLPEAELKEMFAAAGAGDGRRVIAYCGGGIAASSAALGLALIGVDDVAIYTNSLQEWANDASCPMETDAAR